MSLINPDMTNTTTANTATANTANSVKRTVEAIDLIADVIFQTESFDLKLDRLVIAAKAAKADADAADKRLSDLRAEILSMMQESNLATFDCPDGKVTVCKGRRTVTVTDRGLKAEITAMKERGIKSKRCVEKIGDPYVTIK